MKLINRKKYKFFANPLFPVFIFLIIICAHFINGKYSLFDFPLDDAWIYLVYARSMARLEGFSYNPGVWEAGITGPLWAITLIPSGFVYRYGWEFSVITVKFISIILAIFGIREAWFSFSKVLKNKFFSSFSITLFLFTPVFNYGILSGMEGGLLFFIWMTSTRSMIFKDWNKFILFTALIPLVRPEAIIISGLLYFAAVLFYRKESIRPIFISSFLMFSFLGAYSMYCNRINGKYFSNPFYLKSRGNYFNSVNLEQGYEILIADSYAGEISFYIAIIFSIYYIIKHVKKDLLQLFLLFISIGIIYFLGVIITRPINVSGYYWTRYLEPASVSVSLAGCLSFAILFKSLIFKIRKPSELKTILNIIKKITIFLLFLLFAIETIIEIQLIKERMDRLESDCKTIHNLNVSAGLWIHEHANKDEKIAVNDAGAIRFLSDIYTVDLIGLNESSIVRGEKTQLELMRKFSPTWVIIFPDWFSDKSLFGNYKEVKYFEVPEQEYTLCNCPGQRKKVIYRKIE